jgi:hypothetical protein
MLTVRQYNQHSPLVNSNRSKIIHNSLKKTLPGIFTEAIITWRGSDFKYLLA